MIKKIIMTMTAAWLIIYLNYLVKDREMSNKTNTFQESTSENAIVFSVTTGGINNVQTPLQLTVRDMGELVDLINAETTLQGRLKPLRTLTALNATAEANSVHSIFRVADIVLVGTGTSLKYLNGAVLSSLATGLANNNFSFSWIGNWTYVVDGTNRKACYITTPEVTDWGQAIPAAAATVAVGAAGNPDGTYTCYYRYKITLPDGTIVRTDLSPSASVTVASEKIEWSDLVHATFSGSTSNQIELFRTKTGWSGTYLIATIDSGTTTYSDDIDDTTAQVATAFAETGYYPPPDNINIVKYHPGVDRIFCVVGNNVFWSESGLYHTFIYNTTAGEYTNINAVFLPNENVTGVAMYDEQLYFGSKGTWMRLRGKLPAEWSWEPTSAKKGPVSWRAVQATPFGVLYPANDNYIHLFNGMDNRRIIETYTPDVDFDSTCHASWDGRFYRLFYADTTNPELILDFYGYPNEGPIVIKSTRPATATFYDSYSNTYYMGDSGGYVRSGEDTGSEITLTIQTGEIPTGALLREGNLQTLMFEVNTQGDTLFITPYYDRQAKDAIEVNTDGLQFIGRVLPGENCRLLSFVITITSSNDIEIKDPFMLKKEDDEFG